VGCRRGRPEILKGANWILPNNRSQLCQAFGFFRKKLISWGNNYLSFAGRNLVANQVLLSSMWYSVVCWNLNAIMITQIKGESKNFILGGALENKAPRLVGPSFVSPLLRGA
jgi:hypothetical protein